MLNWALPSTESVHWELVLHALARPGFRSAEERGGTRAQFSFRGLELLHVPELCCRGEEAERGAGLLGCSGTPPGQMGSWVDRKFI